MMRRTQLVRRTPLKARPAARKPPRRTGFSPAVKLLVRTRAGAGNADQARCEACGVHLGLYCGQVQHIVARGMGGTSLPVLNTAANGALLCGNPLDERTCHGRAERRHGDLFDRGFWRRQGEDPRRVPRVLWDERVVYAREDGNWASKPWERAA